MKKVFTISIDSELFQKLDALSKASGVPRSRLVSDAVAELFKGGDGDENSNASGV